MDGMDGCMHVCKYVSVHMVHVYRCVCLYIRMYRYLCIIIYRERESGDCESVFFSFCKSIYIYIIIYIL